MIKLNYSTIFASIGALRELQDEKLPPRAALNIYKLVKKLDSELSDFREISTKIYDKYEVPTNTQGYDISQLPESKIREVTGELDSILSDTVEVDIPQNKFEDLDKYNINISPSALLVLDWLINTDG